MSRHSIPLTLGRRRLVAGSLLVGADVMLHAYFFVIFKDGEAVTPTNNDINDILTLQYRVRDALRHRCADFRGPLPAALLQRLKDDMKDPPGTNRVMFWDPATGESVSPEQYEQLIAKRKARHGRR